MVLTIAILGAGPASLSTALSLQSYVGAACVKIIVLERMASMDKYPGVEYGIQERACRALDRMGRLKRAVRGGETIPVVSRLCCRLY